MWRSIKGSINVFVAIMLIPTVAFTGLMIDFARIHMASSQINNSADLAASSAIAYYDGLLKDVYGLFAVSQDKKAEQFIVDYAKSALGLNPSNGKKSEQSFNLIGTATSSLNPNVKSPIMSDKNSTYTLRNSAYFTQQVGQYMKFRIVASISELFGLYIDNQAAFEDAGGKAQNGKDFIENYTDDILELYGEICQKYKELYLEIGTVNEYEISGKQYIELKENEIIEAFEDIDDNDNQGEVINAADKAIKAKQDALNSLVKYEEALEKVKTLSSELESMIQDIKGKISNKRNELRTGNYSDDFKEKMDIVLTDISDSLISGIGTEGGNFYDDNKLKFNNIRSKLNDIEYGLYTLTDIKTAVENGAIPLNEDWRIIISYNRLTPFNQTVYDRLKEEENKTSDLNEDDQRAENKAKQEEADAAKNEIDNITRNASKEIPSNFFNAWSGEKVNSGTADGGIGNTINKILLIEYGMQDLTCYITNKKMVDGERITGEKTLSGIPKSTKMNHIYQYEMEYVAFGHRSGNFKEFVAIMSAIFFTANYIYTFADKGILQATITAISAIPYVGKALAEAYRFAVTGIQTWYDIVLLLDGKKASIVKKEQLWIAPPSGFPQEYNNDGATANVPMYYDQYLRVFTLFNSNETIAGRIMDLIELNMNHYKGGIANRDKFLAKEAYVIVDVSIDVDLPYFFIPMPFASSKTPSGFNTKIFQFRGVTKTRGY